MRRGLQTSVTIAVATVMIGFAATQARADRVAFNAGCFGAACAPGTLTGRMPLSFTDSSFATETSVRVADLGPQVSATHSGNFSVMPAKSGMAQSASLESLRSRTGRFTIEPVANIVGAAFVAVPEPTTMLLLGTGLVGTAALFRRRRTVRRSRSK